MNFITQEQLNNLFFIRHGESTCNTFNRLAGRFDVPLSTMGEKQAYEVAQQCQGLSFDKVFVSSLTRAKETSSIIMQYNNLPSNLLYIEPRLDERDFGTLSLNNKSLLQKEFSIVEYEKALNLDSTIMKEGESFDVFSKRVSGFFYETIIPLLKNNEKVLIVAHKYVVELFFTLLMEKPSVTKFDFRLPNAELLQGNKVAHYLKHENKKLNILKDWLLLNTPWLFVCSVMIGLLFNFLDFQIDTNPYFLLFLITTASMITLAQTNIEDYSVVFKSDAVIKVIILRYLFLPLILILMLDIFNLLQNQYIFVTVLFLLAPSAIITISISKSFGGFILPTGIFIYLSSFISLIPLYFLFYFLDNSSFISFAKVYIFVLFISVIFPFIIVWLFRKYKPITTVKFAQRNGYISILLISLFIVLLVSNLEVLPIETLFFSVGIILFLRLIAIVFNSSQSLYALDSYLSMAYPNIFLITILTLFLGNTNLENTVSSILVFYFLAILFDNWYSRFFKLSINDIRLTKLLGINPK